MLDTTSRPRVFSVGTVEDSLFDYDLGFGEQQLIPNSQVITSSSQIPRDFPKQTPLNPTAYIKVPFYIATLSYTNIDNQESLSYTLAALSTDYIENFEALAHFDCAIEQDTIVKTSTWLLAWFIEAMDNVTQTTKTNPRWYHLDNPPKDIVIGSNNLFS